MNFASNFCFLEKLEGYTQADIVVLLTVVCNVIAYF